MIDYSTSSRHSGWRPVAQWAVLTAVAYLLAADLHLQVRGPAVTLDVRDLDLRAALFGFLFGALSGLIIAALQWLVLKRWVLNVRWWLPLNVVGFGLVHFLNDAVPYRPLSLPLLTVLHGCIIGVAQYIALRHALVRAVLWLPLAASAWFVGFQVGLALLLLVGVGDPIAERAAELGAAGLIIGLITGVGLQLLHADRHVVAPDLTHRTLIRRE